jgi:hypothetical protein
MTSVSIETHRRESIHTVIVQILHLYLLRNKQKIQTTQTQTGKLTSEIQVLLFQFPQLVDAKRFSDVTAEIQFQRIIFVSF